MQERSQRRNQQCHRNEAYVAHDEAQHLADLRILQIACVGVFVQDYPGIGAKVPVICPAPVSTACTRAAPCCSRQSVKPPVEVPTSMQIAPATVIPNCSKRASSFTPPRLTIAQCLLPLQCPASRATATARLIRTLAVDDHLARQDQAPVPFRAIRPGRARPATCPGAVSSPLFRPFAGR